MSYVGEPSHWVGVITVVESSEEDEEMSEAPGVAAEPTTSIDQKAVPRGDFEMSPQVDIEAGPQDATDGDPEVPTHLIFRFGRVKSVADTTEVGTGNDGGDKGADETGDRLEAKTAKGVSAFLVFPSPQTVLHGIADFDGDFSVNKVDRPLDDLSMQI
ncbi:hypothetical protein ACLOJK_041047 [Asimina triloba]